MDEKLRELTLAMVEYERGCPERVQHFLKVHSFARLIGAGEKLDAATLYRLEAAALVHDIGIKPSLEKYGDDLGPHQEREGMEPAREMLTRLGFAPELVERVVFLVGHHHTYTAVDGPDYRILLEADMLVNLYEHGNWSDAAPAALRNVFRTVTGTHLCQTMFDVAETAKSAE